MRRIMGSINEPLEECNDALRWNNMEAEERKWVEEAMELASRASEKGLTVLFVRCLSDEPNYVVTNACSGDVIKALGYVPGPIRAE